MFPINLQWSEERTTRLQISQFPYSPFQEATSLQGYNHPKSKRKEKSARFSNFPPPPQKSQNLPCLVSPIKLASSLAIAMAGVPLVIDWDSIDDDFLDVVLVPSSAPATPEIAALSDHQLRDKIRRMRGFLKDTTRLPDGGDKWRISLAQCQDELRRRETTPFPKVLFIFIFFKSY
jgi:hypothetical protein